MLSTAQLAFQQQVISFKRILIATDFSDISQPAQVWGLGVARHCGSEVYFAHANSPEARRSIPLDLYPRKSIAGGSRQRAK